MEETKIRENSLKSSFEVTSKIEPFYTGGKVQFSKNQEYIFCSCSDRIKILRVETGKVIHSLQEEGDDITSFAVTLDDRYVVTASKSLLLRQWEWEAEKQIRSWRAIHTSPISCMTFDVSSTLMATGSSDSTVKIWDIEKQYFTHNFRGSQGVISLVCFHPDVSCLQLFSAADDYKIRIWDLVRSRCLAVLENHYSVVTSLAFSKNRKYMISGSRDNVLNVWDLPNRKSIKTIPAFEGIESVLALPSDLKCVGCIGDNKEYFVTAGSKGLIRVWSLPDGKCVHTQSTFPSNTTSTDRIDNSDVSEVVQACLCENLGALAVVTYDHNILFYDLDTFKKRKQLVGYNDDVLDLCFAGEEEQYLAVATNSNQLRVYSLDTMHCDLLTGHTNIILSLDVSRDGTMLVSGSKSHGMAVTENEMLPRKATFFSAKADSAFHPPEDHRVRIWKLMGDRFQCVGVGKGHTHAVGTVSWSRLNNKFIVSGSQDYTIKVWGVPLEFQEDSECANLTVKLTEKAHDKDINSITVAPNDKILATGSQDRTAKVWRISDGSLLGTLRGHKKGIWCVRFSPVDRCLATSSADATIKIWALSDLSCVKTFGGHDSSVLKVTFISRGMQLVSCGSEGLLKLWTIRTNECVKTFDQHVDKVWAMALSKTEELLVSGAADSVINIWKDVTVAEQEAAWKITEEKLLKDQELSNLLHEKNYIKAIGLAITLDQPFRVMKIMKDILMLKGGMQQLSEAMTGLRDDQIDSILRYIVEWNTNSRNTVVTQTVLSLILKMQRPSSLIKRTNMKEVIEALVPYTEKHFQRMNRLLQQASFLEYTWQSMKLSETSTEGMNSAARDTGSEMKKTSKEAGARPENEKVSEELSCTDGEPIVVNGHEMGLSQESHEKGLSQDSHEKGLSQESHEKGLSQDSHEKELFQDSHEKELFQDGHEKGLSQDGHEKGPCQDSHEKGLSQDGHEKGLSQDGHEKGLSQDSGLRGSEVDMDVLYNDKENSFLDLHDESGDESKNIKKKRSKTEKALSGKKLKTEKQFKSKTPNAAKSGFRNRLKRKAKTKS